MAYASVHAGEAKISGQTFLNYNYENQDNNEFELKRAYLTYENSLNKDISYKVQLDAGQGQVSSYSVYVKAAKVDWKTSFGKLTFGIQGMNMFKIQENTWGYRYIDNPAMDRQKYSSSADLGIGWSNTFGKLNTSLMLTNGNGYKKAETDGHKKTSFRLHLGESKLKQGFNAGLVMSHEGLDYGLDSIGSSLVLGGFGGIVLGPLTAGTEYSTNIVNKISEQTSSVFSAYARLDVKENLEVFARADYSDKNLDMPGDSETYIISGLVYTAEKSLNIAPNLRITLPENNDPIFVYYVNVQFKF